MRKVLVCLELEGIEWAVDPIVPFFGGDRFAELSPLRRVPVLIDDRTTLCDSSVICQYLEDRHPAPALYPVDLVDRARARWRFRIDATRWPRTAAFIERVLALGAFRKLAAIEDRLIRTPLPKHREVLAELGVPLLAETYGVAAPRKSLMLA